MSPNREDKPWGPLSHVRLIGILVVATWTPIVIFILTLTIHP